MRRLRLAVLFEPLHDAAVPCDARRGEPRALVEQFFLEGGINAERARGLGRRAEVAVYLEGRVRVEQVLVSSPVEAHARDLAAEAHGREQKS